MMLRNYLRTAVRSLSRNKFITFINISGLALGLSACLIAALYIKHELKTNRFHKDIDFTYRVTAAFETHQTNSTSYPFTEALRQEMPQVTETVRMAEDETSLEIGEQLVKGKVLMADPNFFSFFTFPLASGTPASALNGMRKVVISKGISERYFKNENPLGRIIHIKRDSALVDFEVSAVAEPIPSESSIRFDYVIPLENFYSAMPKEKDNWASFMLTTFIKVKPGTIESLLAAMPAFIKTHLGNDPHRATTKFIFTPFGDHHLTSGFMGSGLREGRTMSSLIVLGGIAAFILLMAAFNFMNLTTAQSSRRNVEVGVRKIIGARSAQLIRQFLSEALLLSICAAVLALGITELCLLLLPDILERNLRLFHFTNLDVLLAFIAFTFLTGLLAGIYPALILSNLSPLKTLKSKFRMGGNHLLSRAILTFQFVVAIVLIVVVVTMSKQQELLMHKDLGFNKEQLLVLKVDRSHAASIGALKQELTKLGEVVSVAHTSSMFTEGASLAINRNADGTSDFIYMQSIDQDYIPTMGMTLIKGKNFDDSENIPGRIIINETMMKRLNLEDSVGMKLGGTVGWYQQPTIIGVVKDFNHANLRSEVQPLIMMQDFAFENNYVMVRLAANGVGKGMPEIENVWRKVMPDALFDFRFMDDELARQYAAEAKWHKIIIIAAGVAVFLSTLGLMGLTIFSVQERRKEMSIRKVLGATLRQLLLLLSRSYAIAIIIAFCIAVPISWYVMTEYWLNSFAYKVTLSPSIFALALGIIAIVAITAIVGLVTRVALENPTKSLKEE
jgi:putative ABC transport system permease protein